ncbi:MAG: anhydro-N-acetylmuramic acid kinase [Pseudomonadales bacterium]|nr:anhydro-N-acetylmuramic acid kinase [Pseudomonadales bacterium]
MSENKYLFAGIISGTSIDAVDCILADFSAGAGQLIASHREPYPSPLREKILALCQGHDITLQELGETDVRVGRLFAQAINNLLAKNSLSASQISAIGSHGQTIFHQPSGDNRFSMQIGDPNTIAELTDITTIADFRRRDMAAGGQGAPLAPLYHQAAFAQPARPTVVLNLGGIANISLLADRLHPALKGFDTGPANVLMDTWIQRQQGKPYDEGGNWAASGRVNEELLAAMLKEPYFAAPAPKSTGRELFNAAWLDTQLTDFASLDPADIQATLLALTVHTIKDSIKQAASECELLIVCGGGAHNRHLLSRLSESLHPCKVCSSAEFGLAPDWVEAMTFAWLAEQTLRQHRIDSRGITGARHPCVLGGIYLR